MTGMREHRTKYVRLAASRVGSETNDDGIGGEDDVGAASGPEGRTGTLAQRNLRPHRHLGGRGTDSGVHGHHLGNIMILEGAGGAGEGGEGVGGWGGVEWAKDKMRGGGRGVGVGRGARGEGRGARGEGRGARVDQGADG